MSASCTSACFRRAMSICVSRLRLSRPSAEASLSRLPRLSFTSRWARVSDATRSSATARAPLTCSERTRPGKLELRLRLLRLSRLEGKLQLAPHASQRRGGVRG